MGLEQKFPKDWDIITCVNFLQRKIILNSVLYYEYDTNELTDKKFDAICKQLVKLHKEIDVSQSQYGYVYIDFDGSTGFDLWHGLTEKDKDYLHHLFIRKTSRKNGR